MALSVDTQRALANALGSQVAANEFVNLVSAEAIADIGASISEITDPSDGPSDADGLRDDLVANTLPSISTKLASIGTKVNAILARLRAAGIIGS